MNTPSTAITTITTTDGLGGKRIGEKVLWDNGSECRVLDDRFPALKRAGIIIQRTLLVRSEEGREGFVFIKP